MSAYILIDMVKIRDWKVHFNTTVDVECKNFLHNNSDINVSKMVNGIIHQMILAGKKSEIRVVGGKVHPSNPTKVENE